jgi:hypothetical protein
MLLLDHIKCLRQPSSDAYTHLTYIVRVLTRLRHTMRGTSKGKLHVTGNTMGMINRNNVEPPEHKTVPLKKNSELKSCRMLNAD